VTERMIESGGVRLCVETFGDPGDPPVLLVMGMAGSMLWWDEGFCRALAAGGRLVVRYDHRDTGRSTTYEPGRPGYGGDDLVADIGRVLDGLGLPTAHVFGVSMGGALAPVFALDHPDRVRSLVLMSTSPAGPGGDLPGIADDYAAFLAQPAADTGNPDAVAAHLLAEIRVLAGGRRPFPEARMRALVARDMARADRYASTGNHAVLEGGEPWRHRLGSITVPTLVIHGTADPLFGVEHGVALAEEIPGARLMTLADAGHGLEPADHAVVVRAVLAHTAG
jgi:pimeloyl-ACP methyl ester carboxylesterase